MAENKEVMMETIESYKTDSASENRDIEEVKEPNPRKELVAVELDKKPTLKERVRARFFIEPVFDLVTGNTRSALLTAFVFICIAALALGGIFEALFEANVFYQCSVSIRRAPYTPGYQVYIAGRYSEVVSIQIKDQDSSNVEGAKVSVHMVPKSMYSHAGSIAAPIGVAGYFELRKVDCTNLDGPHAHEDILLCKIKMHNNTAVTNAGGLAEISDLKMINGFSGDYDMIVLAEWDAVDQTGDTKKVLCNTHETIRVESPVKSISGFSTPNHYAKLLTDDIPIFKFGSEFEITGQIEFGGPFHEPAHASEYIGSSAAVLSGSLDGRAFSELALYPHLIIEDRISPKIMIMEGNTGTIKSVSADGMSANVTMKIKVLGANSINVGFGVYCMGKFGLIPFWDKASMETVNWNSIFPFLMTGQYNRWNTDFYGEVPPEDVKLYVANIDIKQPPLPADAIVEGEPFTTQPTVCLYDGLGNPMPGKYVFVKQIAAYGYDMGGYQVRNSDSSASMAHYLDMTGTVSPLTGEDGCTTFQNLAFKRSVTNFEGGWAKFIFGADGLWTDASYGITYLENSKHTDKKDEIEYYAWQGDILSSVAEVKVEDRWIPGYDDPDDLYIITVGQKWKITPVFALSDQNGSPVEGKYLTIYSSNCSDITISYQSLVSTSAGLLILQYISVTSSTKEQWCAFNYVFDGKVWYTNTKRIIQSNTADPAICSAVKLVKPVEWIYTYTNLSKMEVMAVNHKGEPVKSNITLVRKPPVATFDPVDFVESVNFNPLDTQYIGNQPIKSYKEIGPMETDSSGSLSLGAVMVGASDGGIVHFFFRCSNGGPESQSKEPMSDIVILGVFNPAKISYVANPGPDANGNPQSDCVGVGYISPEGLFIPTPSTPVGWKLQAYPAYLDRWPDVFYFTIMAETNESGFACPLKFYHQGNWTQTFEQPDRNPYVGEFLWSAFAGTTRNVYAAIANNPILAVDTISIITPFITESGTNLTHPAMQSLDDLRPVKLQLLKEGKPVKGQVVCPVAEIYRPSTDTWERVGPKIPTANMRDGWISVESTPTSFEIVSPVASYYSDENGTIEMTLAAWARTDLQYRVVYCWASCLTEATEQGIYSAQHNVVIKWAEQPSPQTMPAAALKTPGTVKVYASEFALTPHAVQVGYAQVYNNEILPATVLPTASSGWIDVENRKLDLTGIGFSSSSTLGKYRLQVVAPCAISPPSDPIELTNQPFIITARSTINSRMTIGRVEEVIISARLSDGSPAKGILLEAQLVEKFTSTEKFDRAAWVQYGSCYGPECGQISETQKYSVTDESGEALFRIIITSAFPGTYQLKFSVIPSSALDALNTPNPVDQLIELAAKSDAVTGIATAGLIALGDLSTDSLDSVLSSFLDQSADLAVGAIGSLVSNIQNQNLSFASIASTASAFIARSGYNLPPTSELDYVSDAILITHPVHTITIIQQPELPSSISVPHRFEKMPSLRLTDLHGDPVRNHKAIPIAYPLSKKMLLTWDDTVRSDEDGIYTFNNLTIVEAPKGEYHFIYQVDGLPSNKTNVFELFHSKSVISSKDRLALFMLAGFGAALPLILLNSPYSSLLWAIPSLGTIGLLIWQIVITIEKVDRTLGSSTALTIFYITVLVGFAMAIIIAILLFVSILVERKLDALNAMGEDAEGALKKLVRFYEAIGFLNHNHIARNHYRHVKWLTNAVVRVPITVKSADDFKPSSLRDPEIYPVRFILSMISVVYFIMAILILAVWSVLNMSRQMDYLANLIDFDGELKYLQKIEANSQIWDAINNTLYTLGRFLGLTWMPAMLAKLKDLDLLGSLETFHKFSEQFARSMWIGGITGLIVSILVAIFNFIMLMTNTLPFLRKMRLGKCGNYVTKSADIYKAEFYPGLQIMHFLVGFFALFAVLGILVALLATPLVVEWIWDTFGTFIITMLITTLIRMSFFKFFVHKVLVNKMDLRFPFIYSFFGLLGFCMSFIASPIQTIVRFAKVIAGILITFPRLDLCILDQKLAMLDNAHGAYLGTMASQHRYQNPVLKVFVYFMLKGRVPDIKFMPLQIRSIALAAEAAEPAKNVVSCDKGEKAPSNKVKQRWFMFILLHYYPGLRSLRKHHLLKLKQEKEKESVKHKLLSVLCV